MSLDLAADVTFLNVTLNLLPDGSLRICVPPSATIEVKDSAGKWLTSFYPNADQVVIVGSLVLKPPASSGPPGDTESARKDTPQDEPAENTLLDLSSLRSTPERERERYARHISDLQRTTDGLIWKEACSTDERRASEKRRRKSRP
jgi:hypothetical protein